MADGAKNHQSSRRPKQKRKTPSNPRPLQVYTTDFQALHLKCQSVGAAAIKYKVDSSSVTTKYKVHMPGCNCQKLKKRINEGNFVFVENENGPSDQEDNSTTAMEALNALDGLIVVPDTKSISFLYLCRNTQASIFAENPLSTELELKKMIYASSFPQDESSIKVNGAACLLQIEPNGFACVVSSDSDLIDLVRDTTRKRIEEKKSSDLLYADHGDFLLTLPQGLLWKAKQSKTRNSGKQVRDELLGHMAEQGIDIHKESEREVELKLGHHLDSILQLIPKPKGEERYWLIYGHDDSTEQKISFELNVPGGKRHLGETSLEAAIRETEEEISLVWDERWITKQYQNNRNPSEKVNRYFLLSPPDPDRLFRDGGRRTIE